MCGGNVAWVTRLRVVNDGIMKSSMDDNFTVRQNKIGEEKRLPSHALAHTRTIKMIFKQKKSQFGLPCIH